MDLKNANTETTNLIKKYEDVTIMLANAESDAKESDNFFLNLNVPYLSYNIKLTKEEAKAILQNRKKQLEQQIKQL